MQHCKHTAPAHCKPHVPALSLTLLRAVDTQCACRTRGSFHLGTDTCCLHWHNDTAMYTDPQAQQDLEQGINQLQQVHGSPALPAPKQSLDGTSMYYRQPSTQRTEAAGTLTIAITGACSHT